MDVHGVCLLLTAVVCGVMCTMCGMRSRNERNEGVGCLMILGGNRFRLTIFSVFFTKFHNKHRTISTRFFFMSFPPIQLSSLCVRDDGLTPPHSSPFP